MPPILTAGVVGEVLFGLKAFGLREQRMLHLFIYLKKNEFWEIIGEKKMDEAFTTVDLNENRTRINFGKSWLTV